MSSNLITPLKSARSSRATIRIVNGQDLTAINDGLSPGEFVVTNGVDKLQAGSKVAVTRVEHDPAHNPIQHHAPGGHVRRSLTSDSDSADHSEE